MQLDREYFLRMMKGRSAGAVVVEGSEGGGGGVNLGPLLTSLNAVAMPTAEGYLHWTGSAWEFPSIDLSSYATKQWVLQQGYITSSAISDMATETWVGQQGFATTSQLSHYLALTGGTMEDSIITPGSDSYGIYPETDRYGFIGKSTNWYWNIYGSRLYAEKMELYVYSSGSRSLYGGIDNNNFYLYPGTNSYKFNVDSNGYVTAKKFVKDGGTSSQFLKANGDVDSSVYLKGVTLNSNALTVTNNTVNIPIAGANTPGVVQVGTGLTTNQDHLEVDTTVIATQAWVQNNYLPLSGGTLSSALAIATGGDRKLVLNNTDNEQWNIISFQDNGTEVGYLGLCGSNALAWNQHAILLAGYDNDFITHGNEFTFASAGYGSDVSQFPNGRMVWFNYRTASGNLDGNISSYKFGDGKGGELAEITNGQFSGNAASATKALKVVQGNNDRLVTNANGVTVVGGKNNSTIGFRTDGSAHYEPYIMIRKTLDGNNSAEFHLDYYTANGGHYFKDATSGYADVYAKSFVANGSSDSYVLLGGGGTKAVSDFVQNNANQIAAKTIAVLNSDDTNGVYIYWDSNGYLNIHGDTAPPSGYVFDAPVTQSSDIRMKDIIRDKAFDAESIAKMPLVTFSWKKDEEKSKHFGTIAQDWEKVIPEVVIEGGDGMLAMDYGAAAMAAGVTACRKAVELERRIAELEEIINQLKQ